MAVAHNLVIHVAKATAVTGQGRLCDLCFQESGLQGSGVLARALLGRQQGSGRSALHKVLAVELREWRVSRQEQALGALPQRAPRLQAQPGQGLLDGLRPCTWRASHAHSP